LRKEEDIKVLLIDADSTIPNLALMKLSSYYKSIGASVDFVRLCIPYYPRFKKTTFNINTEKYDQVLCSVIFPGNAMHIKGHNIHFGGTGFDISVKLPDNIESLDPDYTIYPDNDKSYGFLTRGCIRKCSFCFVPKKEGEIRQVSTVSKIVRHPITIFMDNNILALPSHKEILQELADKKTKCQFNQGLDLRLVDAENSILLSKIKYFREYIFAFDDWNYKDLLESKLALLSWRKDWQLKFFVYVHPDMTIYETVNRINWLKDHKCLPYIMRDISCWDSSEKNFYTDIAAWCNQPAFFKKMKFSEFISKRCKNEERNKRSNNLINLTTK
jgi:hypothetical protein